jgi:hypothetical protein
MGGMTWRRLLFWSLIGLVAWLPTFGLGYAIDAPFVVLLSAALLICGGIGTLSALAWGGYGWVKRGDSVSTT